MAINSINLLLFNYVKEGFAVFFQLFPVNLTSFD